MSVIKVLVIDDSSVIRNIIKDALSLAPNIEVVGEAEDPIIARELIKTLNPDILTLDVEMPKMDGITFLENLMRLRPMPVIMLSTLTTKGADITLQALELGAIDFIAKPSVQELLAKKDSFKEVLIDKITHAVKVDQKNYKLSSHLSKKVNDNVLKFKGAKRTNHIIAIGASTGGTEAIKKILQTLPENTPPIVIAQHIPKSFSASFAKRLNELSQMQVHEASHGQKIKQGNVYIAPGDMHLEVVNKNGSLFSVLVDTPEVNRHKPAVEVLFDSLLNMASNTQAVLLTGMGQDGAQAMLRLKEQGARTIVQDRHTSLIWGMPGKAHDIDAHCLALPLHNIGKSLLTYASLGRDRTREETNESK